MNESTLAKDKPGSTRVIDMTESTLVKDMTEYSHNRHDSTLVKDMTEYSCKT